MVSYLKKNAKRHKNQRYFERISSSFFLNWPKRDNFGAILDSRIFEILRGGKTDRRTQKERREKRKGKGTKKTGTEEKAAHIPVAFEAGYEYIQIVE